MRAGIWACGECFGRGRRRGIGRYVFGGSGGFPRWHGHYVGQFDPASRRYRQAGRFVYVKPFSDVTRQAMASFLHRIDNWMDSHR